MKIYQENPNIHDSWDEPDRSAQSHIGWLETFARPKWPGLWEIRCGENGYEAQKVAISGRGADLIVHCAESGRHPLDRYHDSITCPQWRRLA